MDIINAKDIKDFDLVIGDRIAFLRAVLGVKRTELARKINITHQQLYKYEVGMNRISASRLVEVADALDVHVLFFFEDFTNPV